MSNKLKNIKAVGELLQGNHRTQTRRTFGYTDAQATAERNKKREVGEIWAETDINGNPVWWEQKDGYRVKTNLSPEMQSEVANLRQYLRSFPNCLKDTCTCVNPTALDLKFRKINGMCEDCTISHETQLKIHGKFNQYAKDKMRANAESFFREADVEVDALKAALSGNISFVANADGLVEKWENTNPAGMNEIIDSQYNSFKEKVLSKFE